MKKTTVMAILLFIFGSVVFVLGQTHINEFVSFIESFSDNQFIQIVLIVLFFDLMTVPIMIIYFYGMKWKEQEKKDGNEYGEVRN